VYQTATDIANRALQHCGRMRIYSLTETSAQAQEIGFCYDKIRDAELRRNVWRFAIRRAVLRPVDVNTMIFAPDAWVATTTYAAGALVSYTPPSLNTAQSGANPVPYLWYVDQAITGAAANPTPDVATYWHRYFGPVTCNPFTASSALPGFYAQEMTKTGGVVYTSLVSANVDTPPSANWLAQAGTTTPLSILYPLNSVLFAYHLPYGFLRKAPQDPKGDIDGYLGVPSGPAEKDWLFEGNYLLSRLSTPIVIRFVADVVDVYDFDQMFCEGLAARIASEVAPVLVEKDILGVTLRNTAAHYKSEMTEARLSNSILIGSEAQPLDSYITCRL